MSIASDGFVLLSARRFPSSKQRGLTLLVLVIVLAFAAIAIYVSSLPSSLLQAEQQDKTRVALQKAKQALIDYAVNYPNISAAGPLADRGPGVLLCADTNNDGGSNTPCNVVGRLPWLDLGIGDLRDGDNERLWYAVSSAYSYFGGAGAAWVNTSSAGTITVRDNAGLPQANDIVAVIIAPGAPLTRTDGYVQDRNPATADINDAMNYLDNFNDGVNVEDNVDFVNSDPNGFIRGEILNAGGQVIVNDTIAVITYEDIMQPVHTLVASEIEKAIEAYVAAATPPCGGYPEAAEFTPLGGPNTFTSDPGREAGLIPVDSLEWAPGGCAAGELPDWVEAEEWHKVTYYHFANTIPCLPVDCLIVNGNTNVDALIVFSGRELVTPHHTNDPSDYYEGANDNTLHPAPPDLVYDSTLPEDFVWILAP